MAQRVEDLKVWQRAQEFWVAVNAIIDRPGFQRDRRLRDQMSGRRGLDPFEHRGGLRHNRPTEHLRDTCSRSKASNAEAEQDC